MEAKARDIYYENTKLIPAIRSIVDEAYNISSKLLATAVKLSVRQALI